MAKVQTRGTKKVMKPRKAKAREWYIAIPPADCDHGPGAWKTRCLAEKSLWLNWDSVKRPVEVVHVREVLRKGKS